jgi:hypothetical protein
LDIGDDLAVCDANVFDLAVNTVRRVVDLRTGDPKHVVSEFSLG